MGGCGRCRSRATGQKSHTGSAVSPKLSDVEELIRLGEIGYVRGIEAKLDAIGEEPDYQPFASKLRTYVRAFDLGGYARHLETIVKDLQSERTGTDD